MEIKFKTRTTASGKKFESAVFKNTDGEALFPKSDYVRELEEYWDEEEESKVFLLVNNMVILKSQWSYVVYRSLADFQTLQEAVAAGKKSKASSYSYDKLLDTSDPKKRTLLKPSGEEIYYLQYSQKKGASFLKKSPPKERLPSTFYSEKLLWKNGKTAHYHEKAENYKLLLFETESDYTYYWSTYMLWWGNTRVWCGRNLYGEKVLENKEKLLKKLAFFLRLERKDIAFTTDNHHKIHKAIRDLVFVDYTTNQLFLPLVVYLGELQIALFGGDWTMEYDDQIATWIPKIKLGGSNYDIGHEVYHRLLNPDDKNFPPLATVLLRRGL